MLRLLIFLVLFDAERKTTDTRKLLYSIIGLRKKLEGLLEDTQYFEKNDLAFFDLKSFDQVVMELLENGDLQMVDGSITIAKHSSLRHASKQHPFLSFIVDHAVDIEFDRAAISGKFWKH